MASERPGHARFYPLANIVWDTELGVSATKPGETGETGEKNLPELLFSSSEHYLIMGLAKGNALLRMTLVDLLNTRNVILSRQTLSAGFCEGSSKASIISLHTTPDGGAICLESDNFLRLYSLTVNSAPQLAFTTEIGEGILQAYSLPHPVALLAQKAGSSPASLPQRLCLGACISSTSLYALLYETSESDNRVTLCPLGDVPAFSIHGESPIIASSITSSGKLLFGIIQHPHTLLLIEANDPPNQKTFELDALFTDSMLPDGEFYSTSEPINLLGLIDDKFASLARYTDNFSTVVVIFNVIENVIAFHAATTQYITSCHLTPYCPGPCDFFFTLQLLSAEDALCINFLYFAYVVRDGYTALQKLDLALEDLEGSHDKMQAILIQTCRRFLQSIKDSGKYDSAFISLLADNELLETLPDARFSKVKCLPEVDLSVFLPPQDTYLTPPIISSCTLCSENPLIPGEASGVPLVRPETISSGDTCDWRYSPLASEIREHLLSLFNEECASRKVKVTLSEAIPCHLGSISGGYDRIYASLAFAYIMGTNQATVYVSTASRVYISDFLPFYVLQHDIRDRQEDAICISTLASVEPRSQPATADSSDCVPTPAQSDEQDLAEELQLEYISPDISRNATPCEEKDLMAQRSEVSFNTDKNLSLDAKSTPPLQLPAKSLLESEIELDNAINETINRAKNAYDQALSTHLQLYSSNGPYGLLLDATLPEYFATTPHHLVVMKQINQLRVLKLLFEGRGADGHALSRKLLIDFYATEKQNLLPLLGPIFGCNSIIFSTLLLKDINSSSCYRFSPIPSATVAAQTENGDKGVFSAIFQLCNTIENVLLACEQQLAIFQLCTKLSSKTNQTRAAIASRKAMMEDHTLQVTSSISSSALQKTSIFSLSMSPSRLSKSDKQTVAHWDSLDLSNYEDVSTKELTYSNAQIRMSHMSAFNNVSYKSSYEGPSQFVSFGQGPSSIRSTTLFNDQLDGERPQKIANKFKASSLDSMLRTIGAQTTMRVSLKEAKSSSSAFQDYGCFPSGTSFITPQSTSNGTGGANQGSLSQGASVPGKRSSIFERLAAITPVFREAQTEEYSTILSIQLCGKPLQSSAIGCETGIANSTATVEPPAASDLQMLLRALLPAPLLEIALPRIDSSVLCITDLYKSHMLEVIVRELPRLVEVTPGPFSNSLYRQIERTENSLFGGNGKQVFAFPSAPQGQPVQTTPPAPESAPSAGALTKEFTFNSAPSQLTLPEPEKKPDIELEKEESAARSSEEAEPASSTKSEFIFNSAKPATEADKTDTVKSFGFSFQNIAPLAAFSFGKPSTPTSAEEASSSKQEPKDEPKPASNTGFLFNGNASASASTLFSFSVQQAPLDTNAFGISNNTIKFAPESSSTAPVTTFQDPFSFTSKPELPNKQAAPSTQMFDTPATNSAINFAFRNAAFPGGSNSFGTGQAPIKFNFGGT